MDRRHTAAPPLGTRTFSVQERTHRPNRCVLQRYFYPSTCLCILVRCRLSYSSYFLGTLTIPPHRELVNPHWLELAPPLHPRTGNGSDPLTRTSRRNPTSRSASAIQFLLDLRPQSFFIVFTPQFPVALATILDLGSAFVKKIPHVGGDL